MEEKKCVADEVTSMNYDVAGVLDFVGEKKRNRPGL